MSRLNGAHLGCDPEEARLRSELAPPGSLAHTLLELQQLSTTPLISLALQLEVELGSGVGAGKYAASDSFLTPSTDDIAIYQIQAQWRSAALANETNPNAIFTALTPEGLTYSRLSACVAELTLKDRRLEVFDNRALSLGAIFEKPLYFPKEAPLLLPPGMTLEASFTIDDQAAAGVDGFFTLILSGVRIPRKV